MTYRLSAALLASSQQYNARLSNRAGVGALARYLSEVEMYLDVSTLELAHPVRPDQRLQDLALQPGDRLLVFLHPPRHADLPAMLRPGDKFVRFSNGGVSLTSHGKRTLLIGKPDDAQQHLPDVDLREFVPQHAVDYISRQCLSLYLDASGVWYLMRTGNTRVLVDEFELGQNAFPLSGTHRVQFYRSREGGTALGEVCVSVETVQAGTTPASIEGGGLSIPVRVGWEYADQTLKASESLHVQQIMTALVRYHGAAGSPDHRVYRTRVVAPTTPLEALNLGGESFLYAALNYQFVRHTLTLRDVYEAGRSYTLTAGRANDAQLIGCRVHREHVDLSLHVDLYDDIIERGYDVRLFNQPTSFLARVRFDADERVWRLRVEDETTMPIFVNTMRVPDKIEVPLLAGDVISFGWTVNQPYLRFEVQVQTMSEISNKK